VGTYDLVDPVPSPITKPLPSQSTRKKKRRSKSFNPTYQQRRNPSASSRGSNAFASRVNRIPTEKRDRCSTVGPGFFIFFMWNDEKLFSFVFYAGSYRIPTTCIKADKAMKYLFAQPKVFRDDPNLPPSLIPGPGDYDAQKMKTNFPRFVESKKNSPICITTSLF